MRRFDLVIMEAGPLCKLATVDRLDLLLCVGRHVYIPDEVAFEAVEKHAWEHQVPLGQDQLRLRAWITQQSEAGKVTCVTTLIGEVARHKRESGEYAPSRRDHHRNTGELAAHDFLNNRHGAGLRGGPVLLLMDERPGLDQVRLQSPDVHLLTTYSMLVELEREGLIESADKVWSRMG